MTLFYRNKYIGMLERLRDALALKVERQAEQMRRSGYSKETNFGATISALEGATRAQITCKHGHELNEKIHTRRKFKRKCNACGEKLIKDEVSIHCQKCGYDICQACQEKLCQEALVEAQSDEQREISELELRINELREIDSAERTARQAKKGFSKRTRTGRVGGRQRAQNWDTEDEAQAEDEASQASDVDSGLEP